MCFLSNSLLNAHIKWLLFLCNFTTMSLLFISSFYLFYYNIIFYLVEVMMIDFFCVCVDWKEIEGMKSLFFDLFPATRVNCVVTYTSTRRDVMAPVYFKQTVGIWTVPKYGDLSTYLSLMEVSLTTFCVIIEELLG